MNFSTLMSPVWSCRVRYHFQVVSRPYRGCLDKFTRLFHHFTRFYGVKYPYICQSRPSWAKSKYHLNDQNESLMWSWWVRYYIQGVSRPHRGCLHKFTRLFYYFIRFFGVKYPYIYMSKSTIMGEVKISSEWSKLISYVIMTGQILYPRCF